jgi:uncharacterized RDD family membrane protein YckC
VYAGIVTRLAALIVDAVLLAVTIPVVATGPTSLWESLEGSAPGWVKTISQIGAALLPVLYFTMCWWGTGQTLGGLLFGTVVRRPDEKHITLARAFLRAFIGLLIPVVWLIGLIFILWDGRRRALHDRLFDTVVLRKTRKA